MCMVDAGHAAGQASTLASPNHLTPGRSEIGNASALPRREPQCLRGLIVATLLLFWGLILDPGALCLSSSRKLGHHTAPPRTVCATQHADKYFHNTKAYLYATTRKLRFIPFPDQFPFFTAACAMVKSPASAGSPSRRRNLQVNVPASPPTEPPAWALGAALPRSPIRGSVPQGSPLPHTGSMYKWEATAAFADSPSPYYGRRVSDNGTRASQGTRLQAKPTLHPFR